jgi:hypothetical protein
MENNIQQRLRGTGIALITPFTRDYKIDENALQVLVEKLITDGVNYLVALGTTSEAPTLTCEERRAVVEIIIRQNRGRVPLVIGIGGNNTQEVVDALTHYYFAGIDAVLSITPYYTRPQQEGLYQHFKAIAEASPVPVILYNVPARCKHETGNDPQTCARFQKYHWHQGGFGNRKPNYENHTSQTRRIFGDFWRRCHYATYDCSWRRWSNIGSWECFFQTICQDGGIFPGR